MQKKTMTNLRGDIWDLKTLKHLLQRKPRILYKGKSRYQNIILLEAKVYPITPPRKKAQVWEPWFHSALLKR
ncbi:hypothetical protein SAMN05443246_2563 [Paenibacillus sp. GP183]|nr:hypothetical protein SAMN05443246_2563 [Paenibacillus sp. GP183]